ncbi:hypothetical protein DH2020_046422 [Rehmannia glutinosa]|uniref:Uncharacterized protein n=1 Tax=Rehmannia glutinosa TaxID=99300 RepID=A0ABR0UBA1_REHGL
MSGKIDVESPPASVTRRQPLLTTPMTLSSPTNSAKNGRRGSRVGRRRGMRGGVLLLPMRNDARLDPCRVSRPQGHLEEEEEEKSVEKEEETLVAGKGKSAENEFVGIQRRGKNDVVDWDNEMWNRFHGAGFWRSVSQRKDDE